VLYARKSYVRKKVFKIFDGRETDEAGKAGEEDDPGKAMRRTTPARRGD
jgi:hypothetical protein